MAGRQVEPKLSRPIEYTEKRKVNRSRELRRDDDSLKKNYSITLMDHDAAVMYYFNEVIRPAVEENGNQVKFLLCMLILKDGLQLENQGGCKTEIKKELYLL